MSTSGRSVGTYERYRLPGRNSARVPVLRQRASLRRPRQLVTSAEVSFAQAIAPKMTM
jgi:hypothetical protein